MTDHQMPTNNVNGRKTVVHTAYRPRLSFAEFGPQHILTPLTCNTGLILQLTRREIASRYRGSVLGMAWSFVTPLLMLAIYTFVFTVVFQARWDTPLNNRFEFALVVEAVDETADFNHEIAVSAHRLGPTFYKLTESIKYNALIAKSE